MKKKTFLCCISAIMAFSFMAGCSDDANESIKYSCGDGILNNDEICDGTEFADGAKVCPDGLVLKDEAAFACTATCGVDFTRACAAPTCGDGDLSGAELCDGDKFRNGVKVCPAMMEEVENPVYTCTNTCLIDISKACRIPTPVKNLCGNGQLDDGEICDGEAFADNVQVCPAGTTQVDNPVFTCTDKCQLDFSNACSCNGTNLCGNGQLDDGEICDGEAFTDGAKVCPAGTTQMDNPVFACTDKCQLDISNACTANELVKCGDGQLSGAEVCDGDKFADGAKVCPGDMVELETPVYTCTDKCQIDISKACVSSICGDGKITGLEVCEGDQFKEGAKTCPNNMVAVANRDLFACNVCTLDTTYACRASDANDPTLYFSEIRMLNDNSDTDHAAHLYIEIGNLGIDTRLDDCKLVGVNIDNSDETKIDSKYAFEYPLNGVLGNTVADASSVLNICYETTEGWLKKQYDENTKTLLDCLATKNYSETLHLNCIYETCNGPDDTSCINMNCAGSAEYQAEYDNCCKKVESKMLDESCDITIPSSDKNLLLTRTRSTYKSDKFWGLGLVCGDTIHDIVKLYDISSQNSGTERRCESLKDIKATGDVIKDVSWWDSRESIFTNADADVSYDVAECGYNPIN